MGVGGRKGSREGGDKGIGKQAERQRGIGQQERETETHREGNVSK